MEYKLNIVKGETFRREITWKDAQENNLFASTDTVDFEIREDSGIITKKVLAININKVILYMSAVDTSTDVWKHFNLFANMKNGDRVLLMNGILSTNG